LIGCPEIISAEKFSASFLQREKEMPEHKLENFSAERSSKNRAENRSTFLQKVFGSFLLKILQKLFLQKVFGSFLLNSAEIISAEKFSAHFC